jgi:hypothetical protein
MGGPVKRHSVIAALTASAAAGVLSVASTVAAPATAAVETAPATGSAYETASGSA